MLTKHRTMLTLRPVLGTQGARVIGFPLAQAPFLHPQWHSLQESDYFPIVTEAERVWLALRSPIKLMEIQAID